MSRYIRTYLILAFVVFAEIVSAQDWKEHSADEIFQQARQLAFNGKREQAREMLLYVLQRSPNYHDVRILLARTYAWDGRRDDARRELREVLTKSPTHEDGLSALIDVEMWDDNFLEALSVADAALTTYPNSEDFLYKRATALNKLNKQDEALITLNRLLNINPANESGLKLMKSIKTDRMKYTVGLSYSVDVFSRTFNPAHYSNIQLARVNGWGSAIVRLNYANRFSTYGIQPEIDLYPRIVDGVYAYLNYGYSSTDLFPQHRAGAEVYSRLPKSFEASAGMRYLYFSSNSVVSIYTGSIGWYFKSYWLSLRPYITPDKRTGTYFSATVVLRKYFETRDQYLGISAGLGFSPDERRFQTSSGFTSDGIYLLHAQRVSISSSRQLRNNFILTANIDFVHQELLFDVGNYVYITTFGIGLKKRF